MSERLRRWRMILGGGEDATGVELSGVDARRDATLESLYGAEADRRGGLGGSSPQVARWLGDIRGYFPSSVVQVMQRDAMDRLGLRQLLLEPELLESVQPDVHLVGTLLSLNKAIPERSRETARAVVRKVVEDLEKRLAQPTRQAVTGALHRANRTSRPRPSDIDWNRTILANLKHYQPEHHTVVPERLVGYGRRLPQVSRRIVLCLDQSGSMAGSVVYASVFGAVLASVRSLRTQVIAFSTEVADLTESVTDPVELLFGVQLGGGTDINAALAYCQGRIEAPRDTVLVLISDLFEGGDEQEMRQRARALRADGVQVVCLLALDDEGAPAYDHDNAVALAELGIPAFACTPDRFPDLMAAAIQRQDLAGWAAANDIPVAAPGE
ncbi:VWA domain-containing protein [Amycolatopsis bartoniae]|uniref:VWA domain-containing protein n=2 Tax=Amycolatopsis bartoniae TaxID=941986 RepID=A0A8H9IWR8_9PSEU|nr:VWA domain-containing protein [Amycolatopsis bartoniae]TVT09467.1 VWA domain-containing protein [Amycolatopsis bartoniae]GHF53583.1 VWA domain-containing protein [Amycolatopsis bartoniae]